LRLLLSGAAVPGQEVVETRFPLLYALSETPSYVAAKWYQVVASRGPKLAEHQLSPTFKAAAERITASV
jgi:hypothetical protein